MIFWHFAKYFKISLSSPFVHFNSHIFWTYFSNVRVLKIGVHRNATGTSSPHTVTLASDWNAHIVWGITMNIFYSVFDEASMNRF